MSFLWDERFRRWAGPLSTTEDEKCDNAERAVRSAVQDDSTLAAMDLRIFAQGSYKANTNVKLDSDVDICICNRSVFFAEYPQGTTQSDFGNNSAQLTFGQYKDLIQGALLRRFTFLGVRRGDKAFEIHANSYRINADAIPTFEYRWYTGRSNPDGTPFYMSGVKFISDSGASVINWPDHTYDKGVVKNNATGRRFKAVVRVLKALRNEMQGKGIPAAQNVASFLIESLVWNVPDYNFGASTLYEDVNAVTLQAWSATNTDQACHAWREVNDITNKCISKAMCVIAV